MNSYTRCLLALSMLYLLGGCVQHHDAFTIREEKYRGHYKIGSKYKIKNVMYFPKEVTTYEKTGIASWYGPGFYNNKTANGEIFTGKDLTAAHHTLPLPCVVRVTNLLNNKSVLVRVNDRGPFNRGPKRIIDVSEYVAEILDMKRQGTALVRVQFLPRATELLHETLDLKSYRQ